MSSLVEEEENISYRTLYVRIVLQALQDSILINKHTNSLDKANARNWLLSDSFDVKTIFELASIPYKRVFIKELLKELEKLYEENRKTNISVFAQLVLDRNLTECNNEYFRYYRTKKRILDGASFL